MASLRYLQLLLSSVLVLSACGGKFDSASRNDGLDQDGGSEPDGTGGADGSGGSSAAGGSSTASGGAAGGVGAGGGGTACCLAAATCNLGDTQIDGPEQCPPGADCYESAICCDSVWCVRQTANCEAYPACDPGDREIQGECPPAYMCYPRAICGYEIMCVVSGALDAGSPSPGVDAGASCDPASQYNLHYVGTPETCPLIDFICPVNTQYFGNACGCGCQQDSSCPEKVDCTGVDPGFDPLCQDDTLCPYSPRAF